VSFLVMPLDFVTDQRHGQHSPQTNAGSQGCLSRPVGGGPARCRTAGAGKAVGLLSETIT
jgi:hypothetical protein